jgi:hypothetical protein
MLADLAAKHGFKFGTLDRGIKHPTAELIGYNPLSARLGNLGLERQFAVYHGLGKGWRLASPRLPPLPGGRAGPLLGFPVAKRVKSGASKSSNSEHPTTSIWSGRPAAARMTGVFMRQHWPVCRRRGLSAEGRPSGVKTRKWDL